MRSIIGRFNSDKLLGDYLESNFQAGFGNDCQISGRPIPSWTEADSFRTTMSTPELLPLCGSGWLDALCKFLGKEVIGKLYHHDSTTDKGRLDTFWWVAVKTVTLKYGVPLLPIAIIWEYSGYVKIIQEADPWRQAVLPPLFRIVPGSMVPFPQKLIMIKLKLCGVEPCCRLISSRQ